MKLGPHSDPGQLPEFPGSFERTSVRRRKGAAAAVDFNLPGSTFLAPQGSEAADLQAAINDYACVAVIDGWGRITSVNDRFCALSRFRREELIGWDCRLFSAGHQSPAYYNHIRETVLRGSVWRGDLDFRVKDGSTLWSSTTVLPCTEKRRDPRRFVAIGIDVTEQKRIEHEIAKIGRLQHLLADLSARFLTLPSQQVDAALEATQRLTVETLGLERSTLWRCDEAGSRMTLTHAWHRSDLKALPPDFLGNARFPWMFGQLMKGEAVCFSSVDELPPEAAGDAEAFRQLGTKSKVIFPLIASGRTFGALAFSTLEAEREWRDDTVAELKIVAQLFANVIGRQLAERREEQLREELARTMRVASIGEMAAALAHELNQPLAAILSNAQAARNFLAESIVDRDELGAILDDIVRDDKRAGGVIHSLRAMISNRPAERESCCLNELVAEVLALLHGEILGERIEVHLASDSMLPDVIVARVELQQVLINLFINALQAMRQNPANCRCIEVATHVEKDAVVLSIRDHGPGIPTERLKSIFEPFFSTKTNGLGMGLSISRRIIEDHGGRIDVCNHAAGGAHFCITLPARTSL